MFNKKEIIKVEEVAAIERKTEELFNESSMHKTIIGNAVEDLMAVNEVINEELEKIDTLESRLNTAREEIIKIRNHNNKVLSGIHNGLAEVDKTCSEKTE